VIAMRPLASHGIDDIDILPVTEFLKDLWEGGIIV